MDPKEKIRTILDYPKPGVRFRDITTLLKDAEAFRFSIDQLHHRYLITELDGIAAIDSRGFVFGSTLAYLLGVPFIPIRKPGKLPGKTIRKEYQLEYGSNSLEMHVDALVDAKRIVIVDDLVATGGTLRASIDMIQELGAIPVECAVVVELVDLGGRSKVSPVPLHSLVTFTEDELGEEAPA